MARKRKTKAKPRAKSTMASTAEWRPIELIGFETDTHWGTVEQTSGGSWAWQVGLQTDGIAHWHGIAPSSAEARMAAETRMGLWQEKRERPPLEPWSVARKKPPYNFTD